ncbi:Rieske (2Fe-2S) protein [Streptomyces sp. NBC_01537]|uniref:Rieske (2Fe-2S) protein n=1 Tax=Streptomyces sp. NBC_01537 TaxID=2903896 RepID=UPI00386679E5
MTETPLISGSPNRRTVVAGVGAAGLAAALAACGDSTDTSGSGTAQTSPSQSGAASSAAAGTGSELAKTSDIPEGGGKIFADQKVVVTQPTAGEFKAFSAVCTHQGCAVTSVSDGTINCPCHNSKFKIADGSVASGPATQPLAAASITVSGDSVTLA